MEVRVCPKCGAENKAGNASCSNCYASLADVPVTKGQEKELVVQVVKEEKTAEKAPTANSMPEAPSPYGPPPSRPQVHTNYPPRPERSYSSGGGSNAGLIVFVILLLAGAAFAGWWFFVKAPSPEAVIQKYITSIEAGDFEGMKSCLNKTSLSMFTMAGIDEQQIAEQMKKQGAKEVKGKIVKTSYEADNAIVEIEPDEKSTLLPGMKTIEIVLVKEEEKWKIDLMATSMRMIGKVMKNSGQPMPNGGGYRQP